MSRKQASKRTGRRTAVTVLGTAGVLSLAGGASAAIVGPAEDISAKNNASRHVITLSEEEVFDVSLGTFYVFDKENARTHPPGIQLAGGRGRTRWLRTRWLRLRTRWPWVRRLRTRL